MTLRTNPARSKCRRSLLLWTTCCFSVACSKLDAEPTKRKSTCCNAGVERIDFQQLEGLVKDVLDAETDDALSPWKPVVDRNVRNPRLVILCHNRGWHVY